MASRISFLFLPVQNMYERINVALFIQNGLEKQSKYNFQFLHFERKFVAMSASVK
jgi:hypothetical protein